HVVTTSTCTPGAAGTIAIYTRVAVRFPPVSRAVLLPLKRLTERILAQDKVVLESQTQTMETLGRRFVSVDADAPTAWVERALKLYQGGAFPPSQLRSAEVLYRL